MMWPWCSCNSRPSRRSARSLCAGSCRRPPPPARSPGSSCATCLVIGVSPRTQWRRRPCSLLSSCPTPRAIPTKASSCGLKCTLTACGSASLTVLTACPRCARRERRTRQGAGCGWWRCCPTAGASNPTTWARPCGSRWPRSPERRTLGPGGRPGIWTPPARGPGTGSGLGRLADRYTPGCPGSWGPGLGPGVAGERAARRSLISVSKITSGASSAIGTGLPRARRSASLLRGTTTKK